MCNSFYMFREQGNYCIFKTCFIISSLFFDKMLYINNFMVCLDTWEFIVLDGQVRRHTSVIYFCVCICSLLMILVTQLCIMEWQGNEWIINGERNRRKQSGKFWCTVQKFVWRDWDSHTKPEVWSAGFEVGLWT
jgi:hypothetical protein